MNRQHVALAAIALLSVLALSVAAANLDATAESSPGVGVGSSEIGIGSDEEFSFGGPAPQPQEESSVSPFYRLLSQLVGVFIIVGAVVGIVVLYRDYGIKGPLSVFGVGIFLAVLLYFLLQGGGFDLRSGSGGFGDGGSIQLPGGGSMGEVDATQIATQPAVPTAFAIIFGIVLVLFIFAYTQSVRGDDEDEETVPGAPQVDVSEIGAVAGRAARRIERNGGEPDNEVYRAWKAMTDHLNLPNPATSTPTEFADAAVAAGMESADVAELTRLFEEVRYGGHTPTDERESRAVSALRRIERTYGEGAV
ncbi:MULTISPECIES: DUF4129 domain-containing protein [unclassified Haladaptatus]|uniref:DUF4129 domain-containing protein n=1 Tax=unclassified Haladaptatus TaxID=2622732 RepID=UPI0023E763D3|nr:MULTISPECIES: DUF4129 domain-containing protein [unclassified Haladaptatus]